MNYKRLFSLALILLVSLSALSGCGTKNEVSEITYNDILQANTTTSLLKEHTSISFVYKEYIDTETSYQFYCDANTYAINLGTYQLVYTEQMQGTVTDNQFTPTLNMGDEQSYDDKHAYLLLSPSEAETVTSCVDQADGTLLVMTAISEEESKATIESAFGSAQAGEYVEYEYTVDASNYQLLTYAGYACREGQERVLLQSVEQIEFDVQVPEYLAQAMEMNNTVLTQPADTLRTVSVTLDPGTAQAETLSVTVPKGIGVVFNYKDGYSTLYTDHACTQVYTDGSSDKNEDLTLYCTPDAY